MTFIKPPVRGMALFITGPCKPDFLPGVIIHPPLPTMFFAPVFAALVASAQIASVFASNGTSLLRIIPRDNLIGLKFARRQGDTCPPHVF